MPCSICMYHIILLQFDTKCYFICSVISLLPGSSFSFTNNNCHITQHIKPHYTTWTMATQSLTISQWKKWILTNGRQSCMCLQGLVNVCVCVCWGGLRRVPRRFPSHEQYRGCLTVCSCQSPARWRQRRTGQQRLESTPDCDERTELPPSPQSCFQTLCKVKGSWRWEKSKNAFCGWDAFAIPHRCMKTSSWTPVMCRPTLFTQSVPLSCKLGLWIDLNI